MSRVAKIATGVVVLAVVFGVYLFAVSKTQQFIAKQARELRIKDVESLTRVYFSLGGHSSNVTNIDLLIERVAQEVPPGRFRLT